MKETLLLYHVADDVQKDIKNIAEQLHIQIQYLDESQLHETMGHILNIDGFDLDTVAYHCKILPDADLLDSYESTCCIENKIQIEFCECLMLMLRYF